MLSLSQLEHQQTIGGLHLWSPADGAIKRCLWMSTQAHSQIGAFIATAPTSRAAALFDDLDQFATGRMITFGEHGYLKRLTQPIDGTWEIRSLVQPAFRLIGMFARPDDLVVLYAGPRKGLPWKKASQAAHATWKALFPGCTPLTGVTLGDFVSENTDPDGSSPI